MSSASDSACPVLLPADASQPSVALTRIPLGGSAETRGYDEDFIQELIFQHPGALPIGEIDRSFEGAVPICRELDTPAGPIDCVFVNDRGLPVLVECKLWRNPEARRKVVGQVLDYAKELGGWTYADLQRQVSRRLGHSGNALFKLVQERYSDLDEARFVDAVSRNLRRGRFLLLIVGDGIREGVESITEFIQRHSGLHFTFGLVELPIFELPQGDRVATPRVLARSTIIGRNVVIFSDERMSLEEDETDNPPDDSRSAVHQFFLDFWGRFLSGLELDDPDQEIPKPGRGETIYFKLPTPGFHNWISLYRSKSESAVGIFLGGTRGTLGVEVMKLIAEDKDELVREIGEPVSWRVKDGKPGPGTRLLLSDLNDQDEVEKAFVWLRERTNAFVNALRPRVEAAVEELTS